jgi:hypothetical protein
MMLSFATSASSSFHYAFGSGSIEAVGTALTVVEVGIEATVVAFWDEAKSSVRARTTNRWK